MGLRRVPGVVEVQLEDGQLTRALGWAAASAGLLLALAGALLLVPGLVVVWLGVLLLSRAAAWL